MTLNENTLTSSDFLDLQLYAENEIGMVLKPNKINAIYKKLINRMQKHQVLSIKDYIDVLKLDPNENEFFINLITNVTTAFFREAHHFDFLKTIALPLILQKQDRLRIWSAGCASGEEPYSIGISIKQTVPDLSRYDIKILATDINTNALAKAEQGLYDKNQVEIIKNYDQWFTPNLQAQGLSYKINSEIKALIRFRKLNLLEHWPMKQNFDIIFFRNLAIYMAIDATNFILRHFDALLPPQGFLILGHSESMNILQADYESMGKSIYQKLPQQGNSIEL